MIPSSSVSTSPVKTSISSSSLNTSQSSSIIKSLIKELGENLNVNADEFVKDEFDLKSFTSSIVKTNVLSEHLSKLSQNINILDKEIKEQVSVHHEELLHQAINIETLEEMLDMVQTRISSLKSTSERLRLKISTPFTELNLRILQLSRLQAACDTLRRIKGILHNSAKLRVYTQTGLKEIVKSAQCLNELDFLLKDFDASGIEIIEADVHFAHKSRHEVEEQAQLILEKGLIHQDQTQIGTALQVFYSLNVLTQKLNQCLKSNEKNFQKVSMDLLDTTSLTLKSTSSTSNLTSLPSSASLASYNNPIQANASNIQFPGRTTMPNVGSMSQFRAQLWSNVEKLMDSLYDSHAQIFQLQQILEKKKDLLTNLLYIDEIDFSVLFNGKMYLSSLTMSNQEEDYSTGEPSPISKVLTYESIYAIVELSEHNMKKTIEFLYEQWRCLTNVLSTSILSACNQSNYIKQTFQNEYPKLLKLQNDLWLRLLQLNPLMERYRYLNTQVSAVSQSGQSLSQSDKSKQKNQQSINQAKLSLNSTGSNSANYLTSYELLRKCFFDLENSYLNRSLSHLFDPINLVFSQSIDKQINKTDIETYLKGI